MTSVSSSFLSQPLIRVRASPPNYVVCHIPTNLPKRVPILPAEKPSTYSSSSSSRRAALQSFPLAASIALLLWSNPDPLQNSHHSGNFNGAAKAGFLTGFSGIESVPGPQLPPIDFLNRINEENQKKYAEADAKFKSSPLLKKLLEQSKLNKEKNRQQISDKYCVRGAEWGVGDCSAEAMSPAERDKFVANLKQKAGIE